MSGLGPLFIDVAGVELLPGEREKLAHPLVGGVILFTRNYDNTDQLKVLVKSIKAVRRPALLVAVDQEGGRVQRFRNGFTVLPPPRVYGDLYDRDKEAGLNASRCAGFLIAAELRAVGVDISFAPVLDVGTIESTVIGDRAFHRDPVIVSEMARAYIEGMNIGGMKATGKHFPGHGSVAEDSHICLPRDDRPWSEIDRCDLLPYRRLSMLLHGVMTAHVNYPDLDDQLPTYSTFWLRTILRQDIGFKGLIFSDDLNMDGAKIKGGPVQRVAAALAAGCDMALMCNNPDDVDLVLDRLEFKLPRNTPQNVLAMTGGATDKSFQQHARITMESLGA
jgi:beta-N-acetylhexosaminidase